MNNEERKNQEIDQALLLARIYHNCEKTYLMTNIILREVATIKAQNVGADSECLIAEWKQAIDEAYKMDADELTELSKERLNKSKP